MASGWVKSLHCKSKAVDDVINTNTSKHILPSSSCRRSSQAIKDVIETKHSTIRYSTPIKSKPEVQPVKPRPNSKPKPKPKPKQKPKTERLLPPPPSPPAPPLIRRCAGRNHPDPIFPSLTELPEGHPSRNVVEIIFHSSWGDKAFSGRIEVIFKVQNGSRAVARFEEYRDTVKLKAGSCAWSGEEIAARCVADGNEMMRFQCLGPASDARGGGAWVLPGCKGAAVRTFSGSGGAHESAGGGKGRRAMLVCRVVAGRVARCVGFDSVVDCRVGFDSVSSGESGEELLLFDQRAVLPCFLIIYRL